MAYDHSGESVCIARAPTLDEPAVDAAPKLVAPSITTPSASVSTTAPVGEHLAHRGGQLNRVVLSPLHAAPSAAPLAPPTSSALQTPPVHPFRVFSNPASPLQSVNIGEIGGLAPPIVQGGASLRRVIQSGVIADARNRDPQCRVQPCALDHSYATSTPSDKKVGNQFASDSSCDGCNSGGGEWEDEGTPLPSAARWGRLSAFREKEHDDGPSCSHSHVNPRRRLGSSNGNKFKGRGRGCGVCPGCLRDDCGMCRYCMDKPKYGGPGTKRQRCAERACSNLVSFFKSAGGHISSCPSFTQRVGKEQLLKEAERYESLEATAPNQGMTELSQFYDDSATRLLSVVPMEVIQNPQSSVRATSNESCGKQSMDRLNNVKAIGDNVEHPVVAEPPQIAKPDAEHHKMCITENGAKDKRQQSKTKEVPTEGATEVVFLGTSPDKETVEDSSKDTVSTIAGDKTEPAPVVAKVPRTRSQVKRERSQSVSSLPAEKVKVPLKLTVGRKRRTLSCFGELKMKCLFCGRQRKQAMARSEKFCTQRCIQQWSEAHPGEDLKTAEEEDISDASCKSLLLESGAGTHQETTCYPHIAMTRPKRPRKSRELKNLQIDMACKL